ncbi:MAG: hypothetical protein JSU79_09025 [Dehalococcoidales bacterium]|nr:MAG: hypothetical protein JSU79_09025 [Dehalococcoidales bacterium]
MTEDIVPEKLREKINRYRDEIEQKHGKSIDQLYAEKQKRLYEAVTLGTPDRIPVGIQTGVFSCRCAGIPLSTEYYDQFAYWEACIDSVVEYDPDMSGMMLMAHSGVINELLGTRTQRWPGGNLPDDVPYQFVEGEYMKPEEYDLFLSDTSDFLLRYFLPRLYGSLEPLAKLPPFHNLARGGMFGGIIGILASPEFRELGEKIIKANEEQQRMMQIMTGIGAIDTQLGYPSQFGFGRGTGGAPFDVISDFLRGMRGAMLDMYRCPDKLLAACEMIQEWQFAEAEPAVPDANGNPPRLFMALHRGSDGFMSKKQFEKFYWPGLKRSILKAVELGYIVAPVFEGIWDDRLEYLFELPRGKVTFWNENTDIYRAKEVLGDHMCIQGGVPPTLLQAGSTQDVEEHCKKLMKDIGKDGGLIVFPTSSMDFAKPENVRTMVETVKKHGVY